MEYYISSPCFSFKVKHDEVLVRGCSISGNYVDAKSDEDSTDQGNASRDMNKYGAMEKV
jgi:hypothetical protein